eukprot:12731797-Alexandrium_andersonii.AAC.1
MLWPRTQHARISFRFMRFAAVVVAAAWALAAPVAPAVAASAVVVLVAVVLPAMLGLLHRLPALMTPGSR